MQPTFKAKRHYSVGKFADTQVFSFTYANIVAKEGKDVCMILPLH
jgi:hypothetical protein